MAKELSRQELFELVWTESMVALSKKFEISDVGLRKICKRANIPVPERGHWQRVRAGRKITRPDLPPTDHDERITLEEVQRPTGKKVYRWSQRQIEIENDPELNLVVPEKLRNSDILIVAARRALDDSENKSWKFSGMRESNRGTLDIVVQPKLTRRALAFMDTLIKILRARGHEIEVQHDATYVIIKEYRAKVQLKEKSRIVVEQEGSWPSRKFLPTGILAFKAYAHGDVEWVDRTRRIEDQLSNIVARMETQVEELHEIWRQNEIREEEEKERLRLIEEARKRREDELNAFKTLLSQADRWKKVQVLREYLSYTRARATSDSRLSDNFNAWYEWAAKKVDWYDPYLESQDELLAEVDRVELVFTKSTPSEEDEHDLQS